MRATALLLLLLLVGAIETRACPQGYESPEALIKRARLIAELEVVSTSDAVAQPTNREPYQLTEDDPAERRQAQAVVKLIRCLKGPRPAEKFTLIGGPYDSCAPYDCYLRFKPGEHLFLVVDHELPKDLTGVLVNWRCRVLWSDDSEVLALIQNAQHAWHRDVERYKSVAPDDFSRAQTLSDSPGLLRPKGDLSRESYAVLSCLRALWSNPEQLPPLTLTRWGRAHAASVLKKDFMASEDPLAGKLVEGVYHTFQYENNLLPPVLTNALERCAKTRPKEIVAFNREVFRKLLINELALTEPKVDQIVTALNQTDAFASPWFNPYKCDTTKADSTQARIADLRYALGLADDESDTLVWSTFGMGMSSNTNKYAAYFADYVQRNPGRDYQFWPRLVVLLTIPDPKTSLVVQRCLQREGNSYRLSLYFAYFLRLQQRTQALTVLDKYEQLTRNEAKAFQSEPDKQVARDDRTRQLKDFVALAASFAADDSEIGSRLERLEQQSSL